jgi:hypothetical protein
LAAAWLNNLSQLEPAVLRAAEPLLWVGSHRVGPLSLVGYQLPPLECKPLVLIFSSASSREGLAWPRPSDSRSIAVAPLPEKCFQDGAPTPSWFPSFQADRSTVSHQKSPGAAPKPAGAAPVAKNSPKAKFSDDETEWVDDAFSRIYRQENRYLSREGRFLKKPCGFITKPFRPGKKRPLRLGFNSAKKMRRCSDQPVDSIQRLRRGFRVASTDLNMKSVKLLGRKILREFHRHEVAGSDRRCRLSRRFSVNHTDNHRCQQFTPATNTVPTAADNLPKTGQLLPSDRIEWIDCDAIFEVHYQKHCFLSQVSQLLRRTGDFFKTSYRCHQNPHLQSLHSSTEKQFPPTDVPLKPDNFVPVSVSQIIVEPRSAWCKEVVSVGQLMDTMVAMNCSPTRAEGTTGVVMPGCEDLYPYHVPPLTCLIDDSPLTTSPRSSD